MVALLHSGATNFYVWILAYQAESVQIIDESETT